MGVSKKDIKLLLIVAGVLILVVSYVMVYMNKMSENDKLDSENRTIRAEVLRLQTQISAQGDKEQEYQELRDKTNEIIARFPSYLKIENGIMDVVELEKETDAFVSNLTISDPVMVDISALMPAQTTTEQSSTDQSSANATGTEQTNNSEAQDAQDSGNGQNTEEMVELSSLYQLYMVDTTVSYTATYSGLKKMLNLIPSDSDKRSVHLLTATFDSSTGLLTGSLSFDSYFLFGSEKPYVMPDVPQIQHGTNNIFGTYVPDSEEE